MDEDRTDTDFEVSADRIRYPCEGDVGPWLFASLDFAGALTSMRSLYNSGVKGDLKAVLGAEVSEYIELVLLAARRNPSYSALVNEQEGSLLRPENGGGSRAARARALSFLREMRGYTQKALAGASGVHNATISSYERGRRDIGRRNLEAILEALGLPARAWEATVQHIEWLDWLVQRRKEAEISAGTALESTVPGLAVEAEGARVSALHREVERVAEAAGREREQTVTRVLDLLLRYPR